MGDPIKCIRSTCESSSEEIGVISSSNCQESFCNVCDSCSRCSSYSSECDLSFSLTVDREEGAYANRIDTDELPAFEIRLISPSGRSPSPIDTEYPARSSDENESQINETEASDKYSLFSYKCYNSDYVALQDINNQINPPNNISNLETIYEGVFLNTPPRQRQRPASPRQQATLHDTSRYLNNLLEKISTNPSKP